MKSKNNYWGLLASIDLKNCDENKIKNFDFIKKFSFELCEFIEMNKYGEPILVNFGKDPNVSGYTLVQLIETSSITAHFVNKTKSIYLDIFSCEKFDPEKAAKFCKNYFNAKKYNLYIKERY